MQRLARVIATQKWHDAGKDVSKYHQIKQELSVSNGVIPRGTRIIVPEKLRGRMIMLAHSGHRGIVKMKRLLRDSVQFRGIDRMVEEVVKRCLPCQAANYDPKPVCEPLHMSLLLGPWLELSVGFCGPFPSGDYLVVVTDDFSGSIQINGQVFDSGYRMSLILYSLISRPHIDTNAYSCLLWGCHYWTFSSF